MTQLHLELTAPAEPVNAIWSFGASVGRASLLLRKDVQKHLLMCRDELGFHNVRCHGLLADDMGVVPADGSFDFTKVEQALDQLLESGLAPFVELTGLTRLLMPAGAADGLRFGPPGDWEKWRELVSAFAEMLDGRYGCDVETWYFEVGNEPDVLWAGTREEYFKLYDIAAAAIKAVHPSYRVGGPATGNGEWLDAFLHHVAPPPEPGASEIKRCDFITTRGGSASVPAVIREKVTASLGADTPVICVAGPGAGASLSPSHDVCSRAAAVCRTIAEFSAGNASQGVMYQTLSDISDEAGLHFEPFHGGRGLITVNDIRKSTFHAFRLLHQHSGYHSNPLPAQWVEPIDGLSCLATRNEDTVRLLFWYLRPSDASPAAQPGMAQFSIEGLPESARIGQVEVIRAGAGSAYETWLDLERPPFVNREVLDALEIASHPATAEVDFRQYPPRLESGMVMQLVISLPWEETA